MPYVSTKITANTLISATGGLLGGVLIVAGSGASGTNNVKVFDSADNSGIQVAEFDVTVSDTELYRGLDIVMRTGMYVECAAWTGLAVYILHN